MTCKQKMTCKQSARKIGYFLQLDINNNRNRNAGTLGADHKSAIHFIKLDYYMLYLFRSI